ncbi:MAG: hypothetical protein AW09_001866 [Candidatus Accumulibacter phosphatis]|uniref:Transposase n=1 Tax=Candidatus Accumulibacter phosphatis TaxID=327160 RepID=A0A080LW18_9PROT|nr:MAG: hypothetical protein AW09_001866 [Candidatus Accumulibacter phosphatis]
MRTPWYVFTYATSIRANGLGQADHLLTPHPLYGELGRNEADRRTAYREWFDRELDAKTVDDIRLALDQGQPLGDSRFLDSIEKATGQRREARPRGRPKKPAVVVPEAREQEPLWLD